MTITEKAISKDEESALLKVLDSAGFKILTRLVAAKRDIAIVCGAENHLLGKAFPARKESAAMHFENALRYHNFLEVVNEMIDPETEHELIEIFPTQREDIKTTE